MPSLPELGVLWSSAGEQFQDLKATDEINQRYDLGFVRHRGAISQEFTDPRRRPRRGPVPAPERASSDPIFDADAWALRDPGLWEEEKE